MIPLTNTIRGKIVVYVFLSLTVFLGILLYFLTSTRYDELKSNAERVLRLEVQQVAEKLNQANLEAVIIAKTLAQVQESSGIFGQRNRSINLLHTVLKNNPGYTGVYYCYEPNADGKDASYLGRPDAFREAVDETGRFSPTWIRSLEHPDSLRLTHAVNMDSSLYYHGVKVRVNSNYRENYLPPSLKISKHYLENFDHAGFHVQHPQMITEPYLYEGKFMVEYTYPIIIDSVFTGIAGIDRTLESINEYIHTMRFRMGDDLVLVSRLGRVIATTIDAVPTALPIDDSPYNAILRRFYTAILHDSVMVVCETDPFDGERYYFSGIKMDAGHWLLVSRVPEDRVLAPVRQQIALAIAISAGGFLALLPILFLIANSIARPVNQARIVAEEVSRGNFDVQVPPYYDYTDTGKVLAALDSMARNIRELIEFKQMAVNITASFINADSRNVEEVIGRTLEDIGRFIGADRGYVLEFSEETGAFMYTFRWATSGADTTVRMNQPYDQSLIPYFIDQMRSGNTVVTGIPGELPAEAAREKEMLEQMGAHSLVMVPLKFTTQFDGSLIFVSVRERRPWEERHIELLRIAGNVLFNALNRWRYDAEVHALNADLERRVEQRTEQLIQANRELEAFSYSVSHDLRTPLRHIDGFTDLLRNRIESTLAEKDRGYMMKIADASKQMGRLIDDLLMFSRMGRMEMIKTLIDTRELLGEVIDELSPDVQGRQVDFAVEELPPIYGDPSMMRLVLINLISNALKFTRGCERTVITISGYVKDGYTTITISDNGVGFDSEYAHKLFGVFERLHSQAEFEGTGIGLANIKRIILRHDGKVAGEGAIGKGATFTFSIPVQPEGTS